MRLDTRHPLYVIGFAGAISAVFTAGIVSVQVATAGRIARNERLRETRAMARLFAPAWDVGDVGAMGDAEVTALVQARVAEEAPVEATVDGERIGYPVFRAYATDAREEEVGLATRMSGAGFWDTITLLVGLAPDRETLVGLQVLGQRETPGLGGRIEEAAFTDQFSRTAREAAGEPPLKATVPEGGGRVVAVGRGEPTGPRDPRYGRTVDAITGATQTSLKVEALLNRNLRALQAALGGVAAARKEGAP